MWKNTLFPQDPHRLGAKSGFFNEVIHRFEPVIHRQEVV
jgi:hypothetical protein